MGYFNLPSQLLAPSLKLLAQEIGWREGHGLTRLPSGKSPRCFREYSAEALHRKQGSRSCLGVLWHLLILASISWSCESNSTLIKENVKSLRSIELKKSIINIPVDSLGLLVYSSEPVIFQQTDVYYLYAYNRPLHSVDVYNLSKRSFDNRIQLSQDGPNSINKVYNMYVKNPDSVYIMGAGQLYLIDKEGSVRSKVSTMFDAGPETNGGYFHSPNEAYFKIDAKGENLLGFFLHNDTKASARTVASLQNPILGQYNLKNDALSFYPVSYSDVIRENEGDFTEIKPNFSFIGNKLYYGFPIESNIYEYDFTTQEVKAYGARSKYSQNQSLRSSQNPDYNYRNEGTWFNRLNKYPGQPYFYRTHWGSQDRTLLNGEPSDALSKPGYIMFFDEDLNVIDEIEIDGSCYLEGSFVTDEGIFFWAKDGMDETQMKLCHYHP